MNLKTVGWLDRVAGDQYNSVAKSLDKIGLPSSSFLLRLVILLALDPGSPQDLARDLGHGVDEIRSTLTTNNHIFFADKRSENSDYHVRAKFGRVAWEIEKDVVLTMLTGINPRTGKKYAEHGLSPNQVEQLEKGIRLIRELSIGYEY